jgi:hypothetical protein
MDRQLFEGLKQHLEERHQYLCQRLEDLERAMQSIYGALLARMDEHDAYHRGHEHRWGLVRCAQRHPFRLAGLALAAGWGLVALAPESVGCLDRWVHELMRMVTG